jgi:hypothetical protein
MIGLAGLAIFGVGLYFVIRDLKRKAIVAESEEPEDTEEEEEESEETSEDEVPSGTAPPTGVPVSLQHASMTSPLGLCAGCNECQYQAFANGLLERSDYTTPWTISDGSVEGAYYIKAGTNTKIVDCASGSCSSEGSYYPACGDFTGDTSMPEAAFNWYVYSTNGGTSYMIKNVYTGRFLVSFDCTGCDYSGTKYAGTFDAENTDVYAGGHWVITEL